MSNYQTAQDVEYPDSKYYVMYWSGPIQRDSGPYTGPAGLRQAKKVCRDLGHTGVDNPGLTGYPPIAYVGLQDPDDQEIYVHYNPRFKKEA